VNTVCPSSTLDHHPRVHLNNVMPPRQQPTSSKSPCSTPPSIPVTRLQPLILCVRQNARICLSIEAARQGSESPCQCLDCNHKLKASARYSPDSSRRVIRVTQSQHLCRNRTSMLRKLCRADQNDSIWTLWKGYAASRPLQRMWRESSLHVTNTTYSGLQEHRIIVYTATGQKAKQRYI
jgi:hypothetical protein